MTVTATPSRMSDEARAELALVDKYSATDVHIGGEDLPWIPWVGPIELKLLRVNNRSGQWVVALRSAEDAWLGKHRHRGIVDAITVRGAWEYLEYDWVARPGDFVHESPGAIHTLHIFADTEIVFLEDGALEFYNDDDTLKETMDCFGFLKLYTDYCEQQGLEVSQNIFH